MPKKDWYKVEKIKAYPGKVLDFDFSKKLKKCFLCPCCFEWKPLGWFGNIHHCRSCGNVVCTECSKLKATKKDIFYDLNDVPFRNRSKPDSEVRICNSCAQTYECKTCGITEHYYKVSDKISGVNCTKCHNQIHERRNKRVFNIAKGITQLLNQPSGSVMLLGHTHSKEDCMGDGFLLDYLKMLKSANLKLFNIMASRMLVINEGHFPGYKERQDVRSYCTNTMRKILADKFYNELKPSINETIWKGEFVGNCHRINYQKQLYNSLFPPKKTLAFKSNDKLTSSFDTTAFDEWRMYNFSWVKTEVIIRNENGRKVMDRYRPLAPLYNRYLPSDKSYEYHDLSNSDWPFKELQTFLKNHNIQTLSVDDKYTYNGSEITKNFFNQELKSWLRNSGGNDNISFENCKKQESGDNEHGHIRKNACNINAGRRIADNFGIQYGKHKRDILIPIFGRNHITDYNGKIAVSSGMRQYIEKYLLSSNYNVPVYNVHVFKETDIDNVELAPLHNIESKKFVQKYNSKYLLDEGNSYLLRYKSGVFDMLAESKKIIL